MKYIKVTNSSENVNRLKLEKLGFSTKRDDVNTIGQFGSGIKFAPIAAIRKGIKFVFAGQDDKGKYTLEYVIRDEENIPSIFYKYGDYEKPSSFTAEAGMLSWENEFQIYREVIANAIDEAKISNTDWNADIVEVEEIVPVEGEFSVYLQATDSLIDIHNNFDKYFSVNREPVFEGSNGMKMYMPLDNTFRVYCKGVLVFSADETFKSYSGKETLSGFFDYEFGDSLELNEERTVSNTYSMNNQIIRSLSTINDTRSIRYLLNLLFEVGNNIETYETVHISEYAWAAYCYSSNSSKMLEEFENLYPNTIIMSRNDASLNLIEATKSKGYEAIKVHNNGVFSFLKAESLPTYESLFGEYFKYEVTKNLALYPTILSAMSIIRDIYPDFKEVEDSVGVYFGDDERVCAITTSIPFENEENLESKILINDSYANEANIKGMISTLVHEWDHKTSGVGDGDSEGRLFRDLADQKIGYLIYELWRAKNK